MARNTSKLSAQDGTQLVKPDRSNIYFPMLKHLVAAPRLELDSEILFKSGELDFTFDKCSEKNENYIYVYHMQAKALQQDFNVDTAKNSCINRPPRYLQTVTGYFLLNAEYPTRLRLNYMWDKLTVKDEMVYFYAIDPKTGQPTVEMPKPKHYSPQFETTVA